MSTTNPSTGPQPQATAAAPPASKKAPNPQAAAVARSTARPARPQQQHQTHFYERCHALRDLIRELRQNALDIHKMILDPSVPPAKITKHLNTLTRLYETLEHHTKNTSERIPNVEKLVKSLRPVHSEAAQDIEKRRALDVADRSLLWLEQSQNASHYTAELLRMTTKKKGAVMIPRTVPYTNFTVHNPQQNFENIFAQVQRQFLTNKVGIALRYLEQSNTHALIEMRCISNIDKQTVTTMKMAFLITNGVPDWVQFIAPHEEWHQIESLDRKDLVIDLSKESKYLVWRKLTVQGNLHLQQMVPTFDLKNTQAVTSFFFVFARFHYVFEAQCKSCRRVMKDFLPPLIFDIRQPKLNALHETCR